MKAFQITELVHPSKINVYVVPFKFCISLREPETAKQISSSVVELLSKGDIRPIVHSTPYKGVEGVVQGLKDIEERKIWGKGVIIIREEEIKAKL
ncbi:uncharacterized protein IAS62_003597 [Cryptococcus decagattii]|uniref:Uncharacterized protein n=1 Tax=Cryptococcus decagattii TaxID=1859122 RepID=A0ABZ2AUT8_9TREE